MKIYLTLAYCDPLQFNAEPADEEWCDWMFSQAEKDSVDTMF